MADDVRMTSSSWPGSAPPLKVIRAFGVEGTPTPLRDDHGRAWRVDRLVFKRADSSEAILEWQARILDDIHADRVRIARPERSGSGVFILDGWSASDFCAGEHEPRRWLDVIAAGRQLHEAMAEVARPDVLAARTDRWAVADRAAWGEIPLMPYRQAPHVERLEGVLEPIRAPSQVIHGDLTGNVLFADGLPPALIDLSPYWRPAEYATTIVVADAIVWEGAVVEELTSVMAEDQFGQLLARALLFRIIADAVADPDSTDSISRAFGPAVGLALRLVQGDK
jgi:uncharacterized protein (TIGR02569 family)